MPVLKSETNYGDNLCDIGILDEHDDLPRDYESELTFFAFKTIKPNKKYYLMIKCHSERITADKNVLDFKLRLSKWEYDYNTTKKEEIAAVEKSFKRNLYNTKNVPRNLNLVVEQNNKSLNKMPDAKITKIDNSDQALVAFHLQNLTPSWVKEAKTEDSHWSLDFNIKALRYGIMVNSVTIVSLDRNFLVEDRFEKKFSRNKIIVPNAKMEDSDTLKIDVPMHCLVTNKVRGKALISIFPEEHYVLDFEIDCIKSEAKINESWNFGLELLQPTPTTSAEPTCITPGESTAQTFKVRPGNSCIYRVVSKTSSPHEIFPYKKPKIEQKIESNIAAAWVINSASSLMYSWNGFDLDGGILMHDNAIELNINCNPHESHPTLNVTLELFHGESYKLSCSTDCTKRNSILQRVTRTMTLLRFLLVLVVVAVCYMLLNNLGAFNKIKDREAQRQQVVDEIRAERRQESMGSIEMV